MIVSIIERTEPSYVNYSSAHIILVPALGLEPRRITPQDFKSCAFANFAKPGYLTKKKYKPVINRIARTEANQLI